MISLDVASPKTRSCSSLPTSVRSLASMILLILLAISTCTDSRDSCSLQDHDQTGLQLLCLCFKQYFFIQVYVSCNLAVQPCSVAMQQPQCNNAAELTRKCMRTCCSIIQPVIFHLLNHASVTKCNHAPLQIEFWQQFCSSGVDKLCRKQTMTTGRTVTGRCYRQCCYYS